MKRFTVSIFLGILAVSGLFVIQSCGASTNEESAKKGSANKDRSNSESTTSDNSNSDSSNLVKFSSETVKGSTLSTEDLKGKVVLVNYWGTWCPPCRAEIPAFQEVYEQHKDDGFVILGIAIPQTGAGKTVGDKEDVLTFMEKKTMTYPVIMHGEAPNTELQNRYGNFNVVPTSFLFDRKGNHVQTFKGAIEKETLLEKVKPLLDQK